jgi:cyanate lyase
MARPTDAAGPSIRFATQDERVFRREADPKGDRVNVVLSGKFLPYKEY